MFSRSLTILGAHFYRATISGAEGHLSYSKWGSHSTLHPWPGSPTSLAYWMCLISINLYASNPGLSHETLPHSILVQEAN